MADVKCFTPELSGCAMVEVYAGGYIAYADYEALRKRCEAVEADAERLDWLAYHSASIRFDHITGEAYLLGAYHMRNAVVDDRKRFPSFREAIDQAIAAAQEPSHG